MAEHTLDSLVPPVNCSFSDRGYRSAESSICPSDYSSIGSSLDPDSGFVTLRNNSNGANLLLRPSSESASSTSRIVTQSSRAESWHEDTRPQQKLRSFAHKMNFSDQEFEQCIADIGVDGTDCDKLLKHLVKLRGSQPISPISAVKHAASKTKKQSSSKSSTQQMPEGDSKGLRRIVIDGSNVAME